MQKVNLAEKLASFDDHWQPRIVARYNENDVMVVKFVGTFPFHDHPETDDLFLVLEGEVFLDVEDQTHVLGPGELFVVPAGIPAGHVELSDQAPLASVIQPVMTISRLGTMTPLANGRSSAVYPRMA